MLTIDFIFGWIMLKRVEPWCYLTYWPAAWPISLTANNTKASFLTLSVLCIQVFSSKLLPISHSARPPEGLAPSSHLPPFSPCPPLLWCPRCSILCRGQIRKSHLCLSRFPPLLSPARVILGSDTFNIPPIFFTQHFIKGMAWWSPTLSSFRFLLCDSLKL